MEELNTNTKKSQVVESQALFEKSDADENMTAEIVLNWAQREKYRHVINTNKARLLETDAALGKLLYKMKCVLPQPGRNEAWTAFLSERGITRNTTDRVILDHKEFYGLDDEQPPHQLGTSKREKVCKAAYRISDGLENMLRTPESKMMFVRCLADFFELKVDFEGDSILLSIPTSVTENKNLDEEANQ